MDANDGFDGKPTSLNCFYMHTNFEQKYLKLAIVQVPNKGSALVKLINYFTLELGWGEN